jgi:nitronate monooxygenase
VPDGVWSDVVVNRAAGCAGLPSIIQGGMGVGISDWRLARAVSLEGQLGVVSGTALDQILARRLQDGDPGGHMRRALHQFPSREIAGRIVQSYYVEGGKTATAAYKAVPLMTRDLSRELQELCIVANFVEVWLAREGHDGHIGINYLEKIQIPHLPSILGAMLAGVEYVLMGAGIPLKIPGVLDRFAEGLPASYPLYVVGAQPGDDNLMTLDPRDFLPPPVPALRRPQFFAIIASNTLATTMLRRASGRVDGLIVEGPTAGGHNAPPRGKVTLDERGEPIYGDRDKVDVSALQALGVPFWLAGGYGGPEGLAAAVADGATGVQMGTAFAFCTESGLREDYKQSVRRHVCAGSVRVMTDPLASPTGFPFKVAQLGGSLSDAEVYEARPRVCDLGYLREAYRRHDGTVGHRCAAEPTNVYVDKGGKLEETIGRKCICNALIASGGFPQVRAGRHVEPGVVTSGDDLSGITRFMPDGSSYRAADVVRIMLGR